MGQRKNESMDTEMAVPSGPGPAVAQDRYLVRRAVYVLYLAMNAACLIVYGYKVLLWLTKGAWKKIPTGRILRHDWETALAGRPAEMVKAVVWLLDVELAYTLCFIAMLFYGIRWWMARNDK